MKIEEFIQRIFSRYSKGVQSDDIRLVPPHVFSKMESVRKTLLYQKLNKKSKISRWNSQTIPCVEFIQASPNECPCLPSPGCKILRSKYKLPKPLHNNDGPMILSITSLDGSITFSKSTWDAIKYLKGVRATKDIYRYFERDGYIYVHTRVINKLILSIDLIAENVLEAIEYPKICGCDDCEDCVSYLDMEFPLDGELEEILIEMCAEELIKEFNSSAQDFSNDSKDDPRK